MERAKKIVEREPPSDRATRGAPNREQRHGDEPHVLGERVPLTRQGQERLADRMRRLEHQVLPDLRRALEDSQRDASVEVAYQRAIDEISNLAYALRWAVTTDDLPEVAGVVEVGDLVRVREEDGTTDEVVIVHPIEAPLDDMRISYRSPLAKALIGRAIGEEVRVRTPSGIRRCTVLSVARLGSITRVPLP